MKTLEELLGYTDHNGECLEWTRCYNSDGYPRTAWNGSTNGKVHRIVYQLSTGESIDGLVVRHKCDNPRCINPDHLEVGTVIDNVQDRNERGRTHSHVETDEERAIIALRGAGFTYQGIADQLGIKYKRVEWVLAEKHRRNKDR